MMLHVVAALHRLLLAAAQRACRLRLRHCCVLVLGRQPTGVQLPDVDYDNLRAALTDNCRK